MKIKFLCIILFLSAGFTHKVNAQAKKYVLFEHFTNASCAPCAAQNPIFDTLILKKNYGKIHHISYHTNWPGTDPMNAYNASEVQSRVTYYNVTGVPTANMLGNKYSGGPAGVTQRIVNKAASDVSPVRIKVRQTANGPARDVRVVVYSLKSVPAGSYKILTAVVEKEINYPAAPGLNGEKYFPDVFRMMLPNSTGDIYTPASMGDSVVFNYNFSLDPATWDTSKIYLVSIIQNTSTKEVINSGSSIDPEWEFVPVSKGFLAASKSTTKTFHYTIYNLSDSASEFKVKMNITNPAGWTSSFEINSIQSSDSVQLTLPSGSGTDVILTIVTNNNPGVCSDYLTVKCINDTFPSQTLQGNVIQGITDLIVNNDAPWGDGTPSRTTEFENFFIRGLQVSGNTSFTPILQETFLRGVKDTALSNIRYIYFNVGWSFPSFTDENVAAFTSILDNSGRLMVSGQDVGWDTWDITNGGNGTTATRAFLRNYLHASFVDDGGTANSSLIANTSDVLFGAFDTSAIVNLYGSGNNGPYFYPDQLDVISGGTPIFYYNTTDKIAAVRATNGTYRTVYLGFSLEQIQDSAVKVQIVKLSHDWFHNIITDIEFDQAVKDLMSWQNYPNPSDVYTTIPVTNCGANTILNIFDANGRKVFESPVDEGSTSFKVNTARMNSGIYLYYFQKGDVKSRPKRLLIAH